MAGKCPMNRLAAILPASNVLVDVDASSKKRVFEQAGLLFENNHSISRAAVTDNLFARERLGSTGLGHGVAIPHGRIKGLKNPLAAVLRVQQPIGFDAPDDEPVTLLIFPLVPEAADPAWSEPHVFRYELVAALQEMAENNVDYAHLRFVHGREEVPNDTSEFTADGPTTANNSQMPASTSAFAGAPRPRALTMSARPCQTAP